MSKIIGLGFRQGRKREKSAVYFLGDWRNKRRGGGFLLVSVLGCQKFASKEEGFDVCKKEKRKRTKGGLCSLGFFLS